MWPSEGETLLTTFENDAIKLQRGFRTLHSRQAKAVERRVSLCIFVVRFRPKKVIAKERSTGARRKKMLRGAGKGGKGGARDFRLNVVVWWDGIFGFNGAAEVLYYELPERRG